MYNQIHGKAFIRKMIIMKRIKIIISVLLVIAVVAACLAACSKKNGNEEVVTIAVNDELNEETSGEAGEGVSEGAGEEVSVETSNTTTATSETTTVKSGETSTSTTVKSDKSVKKPAAPKAPSNFKATNITYDSVELSWSKVDCKGYTVYLFDSKGNPLKSDNTTKTKYTFKELAADTTYYFAIVSYNENKAGKTLSKVVQTNAIKTKINDKSRKRTIQIRLPHDSEQEEIEIRIYAKGAKEADIITKSAVCNGDTIEFKTDKKYTVIEMVEVILKKHDHSVSVTKDSDIIFVDASGTGIDNIIVDDEI